MKYLQIKIGKSKARETAGMPSVTLLDTETGQRYRTVGCGYDLVGCVLAKWFNDHYPQFQIEDGGIYHGTVVTLAREKAGVHIQQVRDPRQQYGRIIGFQVD